MQVPSGSVLGAAPQPSASAYTDDDFEGSEPSEADEPYSAAAAAGAGPRRMSGTVVASTLSVIDEVVDESPRAAVRASVEMGRFRS